MYMYVSVHLLLSLFYHNLLWILLCFFLLYCDKAEEFAAALYVCVCMCVCMVKFVTR